jgi:pimeloyl-ACP methyl ester carboxylesterase
MIVATSVLSACGGIGRPAVSQHEGVLTAADSVRLHYRVVGSGKDTIVVLHGGPAFNSNYLVAPLEPLATGSTGHAMLFYDMRGRGRSELVDTARISASSDAWSPAYRTPAAATLPVAESACSIWLAPRHVVGTLPHIPDPARYPVDEREPRALDAAGHDALSFSRVAPR